MSFWKIRINGDRINGWNNNLLINGVCWGYNPLTKPSAMVLGTMNSCQMLAFCQLVTKLPGGRTFFVASGCDQTFISTMISYSSISIISDPQKNMTKNDLHNAMIHWVGDLENATFGLCLISLVTIYNTDGLSKIDFTFSCISHVWQQLGVHSHSWSIFFFDIYAGCCIYKETNKFQVS